MCAFLGESGDTGGTVADPATLFVRDIGTGGTLTLVFAAVLAAVQTSWIETRMISSLPKSSTKMKVTV